MNLSSCLIVYLIAFCKHIVDKLVDMLSQVCPFDLEFVTSAIFVLRRERVPPSLNDLFHDELFPLGSDEHDEVVEEAHSSVFILFFNDLS
jgi:hypothetical protein